MSADATSGEESPTEVDEEVAAEVADDADALLSTLPHYYRGEVSQANNTQSRIDQTTNWAITLLAALLSIAFSSADMPAYLLLVGIAILGIFLVYEIRRYRYFDLHRARVRFFEENVFANALDPTGVEHSEWREELGRDLRYPRFKVSVRETLSRRVKRIYGLLFAVLGVAWLAKIALFSGIEWTEAARVPGVPGVVVVACLGTFYLGLVVIALWPTGRDAKGEIHGEQLGEWKTDRE
ncbi:DUF2270 domain-containing protein [Halomarina rubra]|uniref:DUF2270 domain-containing protein n=1 Tax=Halomarina rubra TaxID=2071873 RepID=A0ABD6AZC2_9EURY|nr:DUF2270 domain-containing protein [Halomarina rubra]